MRVATIDHSSETVLGSCSRCHWRTIDTEEVAVRRSLLRHHIEIHDADKVTRDSMTRWFQRKGIQR
jgi:hypothetical protein